MSELERIIHDDSNDLDYILVGEIYLPLIAVPEEKRDIGFYGSLQKLENDKIDRADQEGKLLHLDDDMKTRSITIY